MVELRHTEHGNRNANLAFIGATNAWLLEWNPWPASRYTSDQNAAKNNDEWQVKHLYKAPRFLSAQKSFSW